MRCKPIAVVLIFALIVAIAGAKPRNAEIQRYGEWQRQMEAVLNEPDLLYLFSAGVLVRRLDTNHVRLRVGLAGRVPNHSVKWQALRSVFNDSSDSSNFVIGGGGWGVAKERNESGPGNFVEYEETVEIASDAGAIGITITPVANKNQPRETAVVQMKVLLVEDWVFARQDLDAPQQWSAKSPPNKRFDRRPRSEFRMVTLSAPRGPGQPRR
jgi:hypothetical protein